MGSSPPPPPTSISLGALGCIAIVKHTLSMHKDPGFNPQHTKAKFPPFLINSD